MRNCTRHVGETKLEKKQQRNTGGNFLLKIPMSGSLASFTPHYLLVFIRYAREAGVVVVDVGEFHSRIEMSF